MKKQKKTTKPSPASRALAIVRKAAPARRRATLPVRQELELSSEAAALLAGPIRRAQELATTEPPAHHLTDDIDITGLGLAQEPFSAEIEKVLSEPVNQGDVLIKPTGQVYLSHTNYTRWFNRAFGRGAWALVPASRVTRAERIVAQPYVLYVHGKPRAMAMGEQEYFEGNADQTYGDALESTVGNALRRVAKRLGVGLELWDKPWIEDFLDAHGVRVKCNVHDKVKWLWRRKDGRPFWNEIKTGDAREGHQEAEESQVRQPGSKPPAARPPASQPPARPVGGGAKGEEPISDAQRQRLWTITSHAGRTNSEVKEWLATIGIESSKGIKRKDYDRIVAAIEAEGPLGQKREPGQEG